MKLRLQANSIRFRLKRGEVEQLTKEGRMVEKITMGNKIDEIFSYVLESSEEISELRAILKDREIRVQVPVEEVQHWAAGDEVGIKATLPMADGEKLQVLVEKDFACLDGTEEQNADTFSNPLSGTKC